MQNEKGVPLYKIKLAFRHMIPESLVDEEYVKAVLREPQFRIENEFISGILVAQIKGYIWGEPGERKVITYPADWWSAFKQRWFPRWLRKRYPPILMNHEININTLYPFFKVSLPDDPAILKWSEQIRKEAGYE